jgi:hypothetical protein
MANNAKALSSMTLPCCYHASERETANDAKAQASALLPQPLLLCEQVRDGQQCQGIIGLASTTAVVVSEQARKDGQQCQGTLIHTSAVFAIA